MANVVFTVLRREIVEAARRSFDDVRAAHPDERYYAFALYSDDSAMTVCPAANSEEGFGRCIERYKAKDWFQKYSLSFFRWSIAEWAYECESLERFGAVHKMINVEGRYDRDDSDGFVNFKGQLFATMVLALKDLDAGGFFGTGKAREAVTLICSVSDSGCAVWLEEESARRLNPSAVYNAFWNEQMRDDAFANEFEDHRRNPGSMHRAFVRYLESK
jgi:hypothetical protein